MLTIERHVPLAPHTTFRIGGPADFFVMAATAKELVAALDHAEENRLPVFILGGGSNLLVSDSGFRGLVIKITSEAIRVSHTRMTVDAGAMLFDVVRTACDHGLASLERLAGIPGSLGGAIRGNAGAFGVEIGQFITSVKCYDRKKGILREITRDDCSFAYRSSRFKADPSLLILSATLGLSPGEKNTLFAIATSTMEKREDKHPQDAHCAGSFFMNPTVHDEKLISEFEHDTRTEARNDVLPAGWLIDHVGLRGMKIGGAQISLRHPNYFLNIGGAKAEDVVILASMTKQRVRSQLGIQLREEVQYVGFEG